MREDRERRTRRPGPPDGHITLTTIFSAAQQSA